MMRLTEAIKEAWVVEEEAVEERVLEAREVRLLLSVLASLAGVEAADDILALRERKKCARPMNKFVSDGGGRMEEEKRDENAGSEDSFLFSIELSSKRGFPYSAALNCRVCSGRVYEDDSRSDSTAVERTPHVSHKSVMDREKKRLRTAQSSLIMWRLVRHSSSTK